MKFLLDENISHRIVQQLSSILPGCEHIKAHTLEGKKNSAIRECASKNGYTIITFDEDFYEIGLLKRHPPKVIWIGSRNLKNNQLLFLLSAYLDKINSFCEDDSVGCLELLLR